MDISNSDIQAGPCPWSFFWHLHLDDQSLSSANRSSVGLKPSVPLRLPLNGFSCRLLTGGKADATVERAEPAQWRTRQHHTIPIQGLIICGANQDWALNLPHFPFHTKHDWLWGELWQQVTSVCGPWAIHRVQPAEVEGKVGPPWGEASCAREL